MLEELKSVQEQARVMAGKYSLGFYTRYSREHARSKEIFFSHPLIQRLREDVVPFLNDGFGHGIEHCKKVSIDAGTLALIETRSWLDVKAGKRITLLAQMAGLLHDISRHERDHARKGAEFSRIILQYYPLGPEELDGLAFAVRNHEAFREVLEPADQRQAVLSDVLYDADKFRWGPDNFVTTLWEICSCEEWSLEDIIDRFPKGLSYIEKVQETFRTSTGRLYGPEFIQCGLEMGRALYRNLRDQYSDSLEHNLLRD
ncbi:conserved hypothetical protein [Desulfonatronospira thiodismutans ASO3-1]|uniref:HD domain-containing protein n=1 Tax=Desulfonatronospira thiodismutans ASO3-1 TaxID=555779 RepID=D6SQV9_9BACT|nr:MULTISPECIES: hypothetical protein [Desulfonatronospira]EFI35135.1 conserved hypothetical protein [Desulfonatronospira thiodismutans ASO3-1]RQD75622.1 MAG: hypothetical protein D5S03_07990 [Desulfonatronospira sp. MSAO_Bac3]